MSFVPGQSRTKVVPEGSRHQVRYYDERMKLWFDLGDARDTIAEAKDVEKAFNAETRLYAEVDHQGTAKLETTLCNHCVARPLPRPLIDCTGNEMLVCQKCGRPFIRLKLKIENVYEDGDNVTSTKDVEVERPWLDEEDQWAYETLFPHTGTGKTEGDAGYFVKILESPDLPDLVGREFEWGI